MIGSAICDEQSEPIALLGSKLYDLAPTPPKPLKLEKIVRNTKIRAQAPLVLIAILLVTLTSCSVAPPRGRKPSRDWSRALYLGQFVSGAPSIVTEADGSRVHLVWPYQIRNTLGIHYQQLDSLAEETVSTDMELADEHPRTVRLVPAGDGQLHLLWASRPNVQNLWSLRHVLLDGTGQMIGEIQQLTAPDRSIDSYDVTPAEDGGAFVVWDIRDEGGIYGLALDPQGTTQAPPLMISTEGEAPAVQRGAAGTYHIAWRTEQRFLYTTLFPGQSAPNTPTEVAQISSGTGISLYGPELGLSEGWVYVLWHQQRQSGEEAGTAHSEFIAFPMGHPSSPAPERINLYAIESPPAVPYSGSLPLAEMIRPASLQLRSDFIYQPSPLDGERGELAVAFTFYQQFRQDVRAQTATVLFSEGTEKGYQPASKTESLSQEAALSADAAGNLHMVWREGAARTQAYYATTNPAARALLDRLNKDDLVHATLQGAMEGLSGLAMFPFALIWLAPGLILLGGLELVWNQDRRPKDVNQALLGVGIIVYQATKLLLFPSILTYTPFSAWLDLPAGLHRMLQIAVPLAILGIALLVAVRIRKRRTQSAVVFYAVAAASDAILTLIVYGVNFWAIA